MNQTSSIPTKPLTIINSKKIITILIVLALILVVASVIASYLRFQHSNNKVIFKYYLFFDLNQENNLPTLYSTFLLFAAALLNFLIFTISVAKKKNFKLYWLILGIIFVYLGLDEELQLHDRLNRFIVKDNFAGGDLFHFSWVIPYGIAVIIFGLVFLKFMLNLPNITRNSFFLAAFIFVGGALGLEFIESYIYVHYGYFNIYMCALTTIEETMEMAGVIIFIHALMKYISLLNPKVMLK